MLSERIYLALCQCWLERAVQRSVLQRGNPDASFSLYTVMSFFQNYGTGGIPINTGFTPAGMVGTTVPGPHMPGPTSFNTAHQYPLSRLFGDMYTGAPYGFNALDNIGNMTIDQYNFGKVNMKFTAINTHVSVLGIGSWIIREICKFVITNKQTIWRRYDMMRVLTAQRVGHADIPDVTTSRTINWMSSGERYGQAADARMQELMDPEIGPIVAQRMLDTVAAGIMHRLELAVIQQCRVEAAMRPWFESGGTLQTSEAFMDDEHLNRREQFGMLNYSPGTTGSKLSKFINKKMAGKTGRIIGCLPYAARHRFLADDSFRYSTRQNVAADVIIDEFVGRFILGFTGMKRAEIFPLEASRDPKLLGDGAAREFASIGGVRFYLEPPASMNTGEQDNMLSVLNGHYTFATFVENPAITDSGVLSDYPDAVDVYDQGIDNMARLEAAAALDATGIWRSDGNSYSTVTHGLFPGPGSISNGFSDEFMQYAQELPQSSPQSINSLGIWNNAFINDPIRWAHADSPTADNTKESDYLIHPLITVWDGRVAAAQCIGHIHPRFLLNQHVIRISQRVVEYITDSNLKKKMQIDEVYAQIKTVVDYIRTIPFTDEWALRLTELNTVSRKSPHDDVVEVEASARGSLYLPSPEQYVRLTVPDGTLTLANANLKQMGLYAGCYTAPLLETIAEFASSGADHQYAGWMNTLKVYWPQWKRFVAGLSAILPFSAILATNLLPFGLQPEKCSQVTAATFYLFPGDCVRADTSAAHPDTLADRNAAADLKAEIRRVLFPNGINLADAAAVTDSNINLDAYIRDSELLDRLPPKLEQRVTDLGDKNGYPEQIFRALQKQIIAMRNLTILGKNKLLDLLYSELMKDEDVTRVVEEGEIYDIVKSDQVPRAIEPALPASTRNRVPLLSYNGMAAMTKHWQVDMPGEPFTSVEGGGGAMPSNASRFRNVALEQLRRRDTAQYRGAELMDVDEGADFTPAAHASGASIEEAFDEMLQYQLGTESQRKLMVSRWRMLNIAGASPIVSFVARCYLTTPNTIQAWKTLASAKCGSLLPTKVVYSRWHQRFQGYAFLLIEQAAVTVYTTPVYSVFAPDQVNDMVLLYGKVMQNIVLDNYDSAAVAECAYVRQQVCGRHTAYITSAKAKDWTVERFQLSTTRESVIPFLEPLGHSLHDIITLDNTISQYARRSLAIKGVPSIGYWHSMTFVTRYSHQQYFEQSEAMRRTKNIMLPSSWSDLLGNMNHLTNFATTYLSDNYLPNFCYRGFHLIPKAGNKHTVAYGYAGCPINDVFWNAPGLNNNLANQKPIDETQASAVFLRYA